MSRQRRAVVVMGVSGCGKSTVASLLAGRLGWALGEADELHPPANVALMRAGVPLTDEDRWPWLADVRAWIDAQPGSCVITCSALRRSYRDVLRGADAEVLFAHLHGSVEQLSARLTARVGHFMPAALLDSQLSTLELLHSDEAGAAVGVDGTPDDVAEAVTQALDLR